MACLLTKTPRHIRILGMGMTLFESTSRGLVIMDNKVSARRRLTSRATNKIPMRRSDPHLRTSLTAPLIPLNPTFPLTAEVSTPLRSRAVDTILRVGEAGGNHMKRAVTFLSPVTLVRRRTSYRGMVNIVQGPTPLKALSTVAAAVEQQTLPLRGGRHR